MTNRQLILLATLEALANAEPAYVLVSKAGTTPLVHSRLLKNEKGVTTKYPGNTSIYSEQNIPMDNNFMQIFLDVSLPKHLKCQKK